jgi:hypothetical protein
MRNARLRPPQDGRAPTRLRRGTQPLLIEIPLFVTPAKAGIQLLHSHVHCSDAFLSTE